MALRLVKVKPVRASVDWLTCTAPAGEKGNVLWMLGERILNDSEAEGERATRWHGNGYLGWSVPQVALGKRADSCILRLSGSKAGDEWQAPLTASEHVSRLDLALDTEANPPVPGVALDLYRKPRHGSSRSGRPAKRTLWVSDDGGVTFYLGARVSEQFGRVYDKGVQQKTHGRGQWWRWEVELKGDTSQAASREMLRSVDRRAWIHSAVATWYAERCGVELEAPNRASFFKADVQPTTNERALRWLERGVSPTVQRLVDTVGRERVLEALGLSCRATTRHLKRA